MQDYDTIGDNPEGPVLSPQYSTHCQVAGGSGKGQHSKSATKSAVGRRRLSRYEQSLLDAKEGRVNSYESSEDFFKKMGIVKASGSVT